MSDYQVLLERYKNLKEEKADVIELKSQIAKLKLIIKKQKKQIIELSILVKVSRRRSMEDIYEKLEQIVKLLEKETKENDEKISKIEADIEELKRQGWKYNG